MFSEELVEHVWNNGHVVPGANPNEVRQDACGAWIKRHRHANQTSKYGWEIDMIRSEAEGGFVEPFNLRPLHWKNRATKDNGVLTCPVQSQGAKNIIFKKRERFNRYTFTSK